jgi:hypothetical protein
MRQVQRSGRQRVEVRRPQIKVAGITGGLRTPLIGEND